MVCKLSIESNTNIDHSILFINNNLICRDLFIESIMFLVLYFLVLIAFNGVTNFSWNLIAVLVLISIITNIATHVKINRFVNTVIAVIIANKS